MRVLELTEKIESFAKQANDINVLAKSNGLTSDDMDALYGKIDSKLFGIKKAIYKTVSLEEGDHVYVVPKAASVFNPASSDDIKAFLTSFGKGFSNFHKEHKAVKYKVVNASKNTIKNLPSASRGLYTKLQKDIEALIDLI